MHGGEEEIQRLRRLVERREESLRKSWRILQVLREIVQASSGEPVPHGDSRDLNIEGQIVVSHLAQELRRLHEGLNLHTKTLDQMWRSKHDLGTDTKLTRNRLSCERFQRLSSDDVGILTSLAHEIRDQVGTKPFEPPTGQQ